MDLQAATTETDLKRLSEATFRAPASSPPAFGKGFAMEEDSLLRWCWPMVPLRPGKTGLVFRATGDVMFDRRPGECENIQLPAESLPRPGNTVRLLYREVWDRFEFRSYYAATDDDLRTCQDLFPDSEPGDPPWLQIEAELVAAGNSSSELRTDTALTLLNRLKASRRPPLPTAIGFTFGQLLEALKRAEAARAVAYRAGAGSKNTALPRQHREQHILTGWMYHSDADKEWKAIMARTGVDRIQAICEAETGRFNVEALKMIRGRMYVSLNVEPSAVDAMELEQFANAWRSQSTVTPPPKVPVKPKSMTEEMAVMYAGRLKDRPGFVEGSAEEWAAAIALEASNDTGTEWTCSATQVKENLTIWDDEMKRQGRGRKGRSVPASSFTDKLVATVGEASDVTEQMIAAEEQPAIDAIMGSTMDNDAKAVLIKQVRDGSKTPSEAIEVARMFRKRKQTSEAAGRG